VHFINNFRTAVNPQIIKRYTANEKDRKRNQVAHLGCDEELFRRVVKATFNQRRKMLRVSLRQLLPPEALAIMASSPFMTMRPEQLSIAQFVELTNLVAASRRDGAELSE
ncbi:MAG: hypothetical protein IKI19_01565, partial [Prevotella sp.]|nr:hypothetical protein [Prevotella sp.]